MKKELCEREKKIMTSKSCKGGGKDQLPWRADGEHGDQRLVLREACKPPWKWG